ncbi:hypothetical protein [Pedobacter metabolipauper]|uniref:Uncharacterized protein n=1 Tax=Pedobacter metabolipauper TaxID=425513 RepID=A0A4R6SS24_9SPHI|nr:hypothetical protein [Pedobacter metabolipauper]TDQ07351.1 hypothetical protein ATK78_3472 [Pedobacter metabolipauper]
MESELINEFYLLQQSRANKYEEVLNERIYTPSKKINKKMTSWISKRGVMLMRLEEKLNTSMKHLRKKYLKF